MDPQKLTAYELVQLCLDVNDIATWTEFVRRFRPTIVGMIMRRLRRLPGTAPSPQLIDDLAQDTYVKLCANNFKPLRSFDFQHENALFGFVKVVAANVAEDHIRNANSQKRGEGREEEDFDDICLTMPAKAADTVERKIVMEEINKCLQEQATEPNFVRDYAIFWLYYRQGLTAKAIADLPSIQLTVKGVESTLLRLTRMVRAKMGKAPGQKRASGA